MHSLCLTEQQLSQLQRRQKTPQGSGGNSSIDCRGQTGFVLTVDVTYLFLSFQSYFCSRVALTFEVKHDSHCTVFGFTTLFWATKKWEVPPKARYYTLKYSPRKKFLPS